MEAAYILVLLIVLLVLLALLVVRRHVALRAAAATGIVAGGKERSRKRAPPPLAECLEGREADDERFPFIANSRPENGGLLPAKQMFKNLKATKPRVQHDVETRPRTFKGGQVLRPGYKFSFVVQRLWPEDMRKSDAISLHFNDAVRAQCRFGNKPSPAEVWGNSRRAIKQEAAQLRKRFPRLSHDDALREAIYDRAPWCNYFNPAFCLWVYRTLARRVKVDPKKVRIIDPSAGWGDRAIAACAFGAKSYHGYDPNTAMRSAYEAIIKEFVVGSDQRQSAKDAYQVSIQPFGIERDESGQPLEQAEIVLTSPPYFDLEEYPEEGGEVGRRLNTYHAWLNGFFREYLRDAWDSVAPGGVLALYIENVRRAPHRGAMPEVVPLAEDTASILRDYGAGDVVETFGFQQVTDWPERGIDSMGQVRPMFVWQKEPE